GVTGSRIGRATTVSASREAGFRSTRNPPPMSAGGSASQSVTRYRPRTADGPAPALEPLPHPPEASTPQTARSAAARTQVTRGQSLLVMTSRMQEPPAGTAAGTPPPWPDRLAAQSLPEVNRGARWTSELG